MSKIVKLFFIFILFLCPLVRAFGLYLQDKFQSALPGDYIVTAQDNTYSLLRVHSLTSDVLIMEEIAIPSQQVNLKTIEWRKWLSQNAPGHTSWTLYEIDLKQRDLIECFSCSKKGWIYFDGQEQFFAKLFTLPLVSISDTEKKKIGPQPNAGEIDHRKPWNPPLIIEGEKMTHPHFDVVQTRWPEDKSMLSLCTIDLYFDAGRPAFPFPYWIEVQSPHYAFKIRTIESGHALMSPTSPNMPHRPPELVGQTHTSNSEWILSLRAPCYHTVFCLFAFDLTSQKSIMIPHRVERHVEKESITLHISTENLNTLLKIDHRYQWIVSSDKTPSIQLKSEIFHWKSYQQ